MKKKKLPQLPSDLRQAIHGLSITHRTTGLSPPEEEILLFMEAEECSKEEKENN